VPHTCVSVSLTGVVVKGRAEAGPTRGTNTATTAFRLRAMCDLSARRLPDAGRTGSGYACTRGLSNEKAHAKAREGAVCGSPLILWNAREEARFRALVR